MKFLGWMHHKLMQNSTEPLKYSTIGNPSACYSVQTLYDEQNYCIEPTKTLSRSNIKCQKSSNRFEADQVEVFFQEESFEPFDFLAIGTFGMELPNTDPPTPTLPMSIENLTNQQTTITKSDLKLINYELEKFLEAEEKEAHDTSGRSSQASIITLNSKPTEGADSEGHVYTVACPLQNYFFANSIELAETDKEVKKEKTSLEELFKRNDIVHDNHMKKCEGAEEPRKRNVANFMKKVVKKFHSSSSSSKASSKNDAVVSIPIKKKLSKALKMFHRKVHPEEMTKKKFVKLKNGEMKDISNKVANQIGGDNDNKMVGQAATKGSATNTIKLSSNGISDCALTINGGHWIKTDSDYLVLEL